MIVKPTVMLHIDIDADLANQLCVIKANPQYDGFTIAMVLLNAAAQVTMQMQKAAMMQIDKEKYNLKGGENGPEENNESHDNGRN